MLLCESATSTGSQLFGHNNESFVTLHAFKDQLTTYSPKAHGAH